MKYYVLFLLYSIRFRLIRLDYLFIFVYLSASTRLRVYQLNADVSRIKAGYRKILFFLLLSIDMELLSGHILADLNDFINCFLRASKWHMLMAYRLNKHMRFSVAIFFFEFGHILFKSRPIFGT